MPSPSSYMRLPDGYRSDEADPANGVELGC